MRPHSTVGLTPNEARQPKNESEVRVNLYKKAKRNRVYPKIEIGDTVRVYQKKDKLSKQQTSVWTKQRYTVEDIIVDKDQTFYKTSYNKGKMLLRHELLRIPR